MDQDTTSELKGRFDRLAEVLDHLPMNRAQWTIIFLVALGALFDAVEQYNSGYAAPSLIKIWHINGTEVGLLTTVTFGAMAVGSLIAGVLGDLIGRKVTYMYNLALYTVRAGGGVRPQHRGPAARPLHRRPGSGRGAEHRAHHPQRADRDPTPGHRHRHPQRRRRRGRHLPLGRARLRDPGPARRPAGRGGDQLALAARSAGDPGRTHLLLPPLHPRVAPLPDLARPHPGGEPGALHAGRGRAHPEQGHGPGIRPAHLGPSWDGRARQPGRHLRS